MANSEYNQKYKLWAIQSDPTVLFMKAAADNRPYNILPYKKFCFNFYDRNNTKHKISNNTRMSGTDYMYIIMMFVIIPHLKSNWKKKT